MMATWAPHSTDSSAAFLKSPWRRLENVTCFLALSAMVLIDEEETTVLDHVDTCYFMEIPSDECLASLYEKEIHHLPAPDYLTRFRTGLLDVSARNQAIHWIHKVQSRYNFGPLCHYLAVNYLDRFLSLYPLNMGNPWMMQLLSVACLSLAAKMEETLVPFLLDLQVGEAKYVFEAKTIQRMELVLMSTLKWRMQSVTPFAFIDYYLYKLNGDRVGPTTSILQSIQLILSITEGIGFLEFKASEIAGAAAFWVMRDNAQMDESSADKLFTLLLCEKINKEKLSKCVELMKTLSVVPQSPNGVLDASTCFSFHTPSKRRKLCL